MTLIPGTRLGQFEILSALGSGGMGEVYRAHDVNLKRDVAIKVLPESFAKDSERLARFTREAHALAALNHPHIAQIYGLEDSGDVRALVMELVEGEDLSVHIARGSLPIAEALAIARQIADALDAAHEQGIIHRDLKPANIKVRDDGTVKVLDFGLAKAFDPVAASSAEATNSPTLSLHGTRDGIILGTAAYMSPEQAAGKRVDKRSDLWAFGAVLMEMLTGKPVFSGETVSHILASVLKSEPNWNDLPAATPPLIRRLLRRCLEKDRRRRLADAADARLEIEEVLTTPSSVDANGAAHPSQSRALPWATAAVLGVALALALFAWSPWRKAQAPAPRQLLASIGVDGSVDGGLGSVILSPDGATLAFVARQGGTPQLFVRKLDQLQATRLGDTTLGTVTGAFFSPDGQWLAFFSRRRLRKISVSGGATVDLCDAPVAGSGTWLSDGTIVFSSAADNRNTRLMRVSAEGGTATPFSELSRDATQQKWPQALPDGKGVLFTESSSTAMADNFDSANLAVTPLSGGVPKIVVRGGYSGRYTPSGHLLYVLKGKLMAVRFSLDRLETVGQAVPALEGFRSNPGLGSAEFAFASDGTVVYVPSVVAPSAIPMNWMLRGGNVSVLRAAKADWSFPRFSPDGRKLAFQIHDGKQWDIWVYEWASDTLTQLTFDPGDDRIPVWTPDGRRIVFESDRAKRDIQNLYWVNADGSGEVTRLTDSPDHEFPFSWHPSGKFLAFMVNYPDRDDLKILPMEGDAEHGWRPGKPMAFLSNSPGSHAFPMFSPDGRWVAYTSNEAGQSDIYVTPFPGPGGKWRVSTGGGTRPLWSAAAPELLFLSASQQQIMSARYTVIGNSFHADKPLVWSATGPMVRHLAEYPYDLHPDGKRLVTTPPPDGVPQDRVVFIFNFFDYLRKIAP